MNEEEINPPEDSELRIRLSRMPRHNAPASLMKKLRREFISPGWLDMIRMRFSWPAMAGALTTAALLSALWISQRQPQEQSIDVAMLLAAHTRTQGDSLIPDSDMTASDFSAQLAVYHGNN